MRKNWSNKEINELQNLYIDRSLCCSEISKIMTDRTPTSIHLKIKRLKLRHTKKQEFMARSRIHIGSNNSMYGKKGPNKGLTKEISKRIKDAALKSSETRKKLYQSGILKRKIGIENPMFGRTPWSKGLTKNTSEKIRIASEKISRAKKKLWENLPESLKKEKINFLNKISKKRKKKRTSIEIAVENMLKDIGIDFKPEFNIENFTSDFFIPSYNMAIECFGDYWHYNPKIYSNPPDKYQMKNIDRDKRKESLFKKKKILYIKFWENDIKNRPDCIKNFLSRFLMLDDINDSEESFIMNSYWNQSGKVL